MTVPIAQFGKDHWSTLAYIETRCVDHRGIPNRDHMRVDVDRHPQFGNRVSQSSDQKHPTRLKDGKLPDHDDWDCVDDLIDHGLLEWGGTGVNPVFHLTETGQKIVGALRKHKAKGGTFANFEPHPTGRT